MTSASSVKSDRLSDEQVVYRAYTRALNEQKRAKAIEFKLRPQEETLSVALTPEKAMGTLTCRGVVPVQVGKIRALGSPPDYGLDVVVKTHVDGKPNTDPELLEVIGIPDDLAIRESLADEFFKIADLPVPKSDLDRYLTDESVSRI